MTDDIVQGHYELVDGLKMFHIRTEIFRSETNTVERAIECANHRHQSHRVSHPWCNDPRISPRRHHAPLFQIGIQLLGKQLELAHSKFS